MPPDQVKVFGFLMTGSLTLAGIAAIAAGRFFDPGSAEGGGVFGALMYASAVALLVLMATAPSLAKRMGGRMGRARGLIVPMAIAEGVALLGIVAAALAGQSLWAISLAVVGILVVQRLMWSEGSHQPGP